MVNSQAAHTFDGRTDEQADDWLRDVRDRALQSLTVPVAVLDGTQREMPVVWVNDAFEKATGFGVAELGAHRAEHGIERVVHGIDLAAVAADVRAGRNAVHEVTLHRADGAGFTCRVHLSPVRTLDGALPAHWVAVLEDLSDQLTHEAEQNARVEAERQEWRGVSLIAQVSDLLMGVDDPHALREIAGMLASGVVAWAGFYLNDGGLRAAEGIDPMHPPSGQGARHGEVHHESAPAAAWARDAVQRLLDAESDEPVEIDLEGSYPSGSASAWLAAHAGPTGADAHLFPPADEDTLVPGDHAAIVLPVPGRRRVMGVLVVLARGGGGLAGLSASDQTLLELTVRRVGLVADNARLYAYEHRLAETLQRAMLPEQAEVDGLDVWTYYAPNSENLQIGGDWYDVLQLSPDVVTLVVGDVVGHDVEAAAAMGQLRSVVRSYTYDVVDPGPVLERVDQLVTGMRVPRPAGLVLSTLTRAGESWLLAYSRAGHLPALHVRAGTVTALDGAGGALIGFGGGGRSTAYADLVPGDVLVYYTDGLIERRDRGLREGMAALSDVASQVTARDAAGIGEELLSRLADHPEDDVAVVVVRVPDPNDHLEWARSPRRRRWSLPSEPSSIARARHAVVRTCQAWGIADWSNAELVVSELVANAVLHGYGHVMLQLYDTGDGLRIEVEDANPTPPVTIDGHPGRVGGFGMQIVERLADWGWRQSPRGKLVWAKVRPGETAAPTRG